MLELVPITLKEANAFVQQYHRHHRPVTGHKFSVAAAGDVLAKLGGSAGRGCADQKLTYIRHR